MIEATENHITSPQAHNEEQKILRMKRHERMGGSIPVWESHKTAKEEIALNLARAETSRNQNDFETALSYADNNHGTPNEKPEEFGFDDVIDIINPLQHIPIVNFIYREITGDEIQPVSKIVGGAAYGGFAGTAVALVDTTVKYETGKNITGNIVALARNEEIKSHRGTQNNPEAQLTNAARTAEERTAAINLPGSALSFTDLGHGRREVYERVPMANGRTAGNKIHKYTEDIAPVTKREPITTVELSPMPPKAAPRKQYSYNG